MPTLAVFYGIIIRMYSEKGGRHHLPHLHAECGDEEAVVALETGEILEGSIPKNKMKLVAAWMEIHKDELMENWNLLYNGEEFFKIEPLR